MYSLQRAYLLFSFWEVTKNPRRICWICFCKYCQRCTPIVYFCGAYCQEKMKLQVTQPSIHMEVPRPAWISFLLMNMNQKTKNVAKHRWPLSRRQLRSRRNLKNMTHQGAWSEEFLLWLPPFKKVTDELGIINQSVCLFLLCLFFLFPSSSCSVVSALLATTGGALGMERPQLKALHCTFHTCAHSLYFLIPFPNSIQQLSPDLRDKYGLKVKST